MLSKKQLKRERKRERDKEKERIAKEETQDLQQSLDGNTDADIDANIPSKKRKVSVEDGDGGDGESPWKFEVDYNDHFETPKVAYADLLPVLQQVARDCKKPLAELVVYDPFYCAGQMVNYLHELGVMNVINRNRDFYADVAAGDVPKHDILVTNPPYSGDHKQKLLRYLSQSDKPFCLLLPVYVAAKSYWRDFITSEKAKNSSKLASNTKVASGTTPSVQLTELYLLPPTSYEYNHPEGTGKDLPPFFSSWFIGGAFQSMFAVRKAILSPEHNLDRCLTVCISVDNLIKKGAISTDSIKRPNPKQRRKKMKNNVGKAINK